MIRKHLYLAGFLVLPWVFYAVVHARDAPPAFLINRSPHLAIMSARESELKALLDKAWIWRVQVINGRSFHLGILCGNRVVMFATGDSMVNAAMTLQMVLDRFPITGIVVCGVAGGSSPELNIGDVVVPARWAQYQEQVFARATDTGWEVGDGYTKAFGHYGMMFPQYVTVAGKDGVPDEREKKFWFHVDEEMLSVAEDSVFNAVLKRCTADGVCLDDDPRVIVGGSGVSGSAFVNNRDYRNWAWGNFEAIALDMESAAVAHVAYVNRVPFITFRSLSDLAGGGKSENEMAEYLGLAAENAASVAAAFLTKWTETRPIFIKRRFGEDRTDVHE